MRRIEERETFLHYLMLAGACAAMMIAGSGCSGLELGGKLGLYRVDSRRESQETFRTAVPLKCYFIDCFTPEQEEAKGS